jgi:uncharacterized protein YybS (DUF2232 family)
VKITRSFTGCLLTSAAALLLFLSGVFDSYFGPLAAFFSPAPLIWTAYRLGAPVAAASAALAASALLPLTSIPLALSFLAGSALPGTLIGALFRRGRGAVEAAFHGTLAALILSVAGSILYFLAAGLDPLTFFKYQIGDMLRQAQQTMETLAGGAGAETLMLPSSFVRLLPSLLFITVFTQNGFNLLLVRFAAARFSHIRKALPDMTRFSLPEQVVWLLIPALAAQWAPFLPLRTGAVNLAIVILFFYLLQGLSILLYFVRSMSSWRPLFMICIIAFLLLPYLLILPLLAGVLDFRFDFRSRRPHSPPPS